MPDQPVVYEVNLTVARHRAAEFDVWLRKHIDAMLALPCFSDARVLHVELDSSGTIARTVHYQAKSRDALEQYFQTDAERMRADGLKRFGDDLSASRRILGSPSNEESRECANCEALLEGQYCSECGQRHRARMISVWELLRAAFDDILTWDSRVWRTLRPLLLSPGKLTAEYLAGRRVHYTPPLRLYLVLSLSFFLLSQLPGLDDFNAANMLGINENDEAVDLTFSRENRDRNDTARERLRSGEGESPTVEIDSPFVFVADGKSEDDDSAQGPSESRPDDERQDAAPDDIDGAGAATPNDATGGEESARENPASDSNDADPAADPDEDPNEDSEDSELSCDFSDAEINLPGFSEDAVRSRLETACRASTTDSGRVQFTEAFADVAPTLLFVMLPFIALVGKIIYPLSRRYYVEHLLFYTHLHSFLFLLLLVLMLLSAIAPRLPIPAFDSSTLWVLALVYTIYYVYAGLRRVFRQGRIATVFKMFLIWIFYMIGATILGVVGAAIAALSL